MRTSPPPAPGARFGSWLVPLVVIIGLLLGSKAVAQISVGAEFPETTSLSISHSMVSFDLASASYPPASFPAYYYPTEPDPVSDSMTFTVFTNLESWSVDVDFPGLFNELDNAALPVDRLEYSTNGGSTWHAFALGGNTIVQGLARTESYATYDFAIRLRVEGDEAPGTYIGVLTFTLATQ